MVALAISTHIPMSEWEAAGERAIATAMELLEEAEQEARDRARQDA